MAVVEYVVYSGKKDCKRTNTYISDGHGRPPAERTNRYFGAVSDGETQCLGHQCPGDPVLATAYMGQLRQNYERQHSVNADRKYQAVTHVHLIVSHAKGEIITLEERMAMTGELIQRTVLRDFASIRIGHDNTDYDHSHISVCPYSLDGSHKLCVNKNLMYDLRREMDHICVEHGYSIIERWELQADEDYREWFLRTKEEGKVTIHPPRVGDNDFARQELSYAARNRQKAKQKEEIKAFYNTLCQNYTEDNDPYYYTSSYLYSPYNPLEPLRIVRMTEDGRERSELALRAAALGAWAYHCQQQIDKKAVPGTEALREQLRNTYDRAYYTQKMLTELDIRSQEELMLHIRECHQDIGTLQREMHKQEETLRTLKPTIRLIERWEGEKDPGAYAHLQSSGCGTVEEMDAVKRRYNLVADRNAYSGKVLDERKREHRYLLAAERTLDPASGLTEWETYLDTMFSADIREQVKTVSPDDLEDRIAELGFTLGMSMEMIDGYIDQVRDYAEQIRWRDYRKMEMDDYFRRIQDAKRQRAKAYARYCREQEILEELWEMRERLASFGLLFLLLVFFIDVLMEIRNGVSKIDLECALWESGREIYNANRRRAINGELIPYYAEVRRYMDKTQQGAKSAILKLLDEALIVHREDRWKELQTRRPRLPARDERSR